MIEVLVYEPDGTTFIDYVADVINVSAMEELEGQGGGSLTLAYDNPTLTASTDLLNFRNVVKVRVDGTIRGAFIIKKKQENVVGQDEANRQITVSGPGLLGWLDDAVVYHEFQTPYSGTTRWFNWGSKDGSWRDAGAWGAPAKVRLRGGGDLTDPNNPWRGAPIHWPDTGSTPCYWIWDRPNADVTAPKGDCYFRFNAVTLADANYRFYVAADNVAHIIIDGEPVALVGEPSSWRRTYEVRVSLKAGTHVIGVKARNWIASPAGFLMVGFSEALDGQTLNLWADSATGSKYWSINAYPAQEPGWSAAEILSTLMSESVTRGVASIGYITDGLSASADENGNAWTNYSIATQVGETLWSVAQKLRDVDFDLAINPSSQELVAYKERGTAKDVILDASAHLTDAQESIEDTIGNALLVLTDGQWGTRSDATSISSYGRIEKYLDISSLSGAAAAKVAQKTLELLDVPTESVTVTYEPVTGNTPWVDFNPGDTVSVTTSDGSFVQREVISISVTMDEAGRSKYTVELDSIYRRLIERLRRQIDRASAREGNYAQAPEYEVNPTADDPGYEDTWDGPVGGPGFNDSFPVLETPNTDLWTPPDDPSTEAFDVGLVRATAAATMTDYYVDNGDYEIALLTSEPTLTSGEWDSDLSGKEQTGTGYARVTVTTAGLSAATGTTPVVRTNSAAITFTSNSGETDWDAITHVAIIQTGLSDALLTVIPLATPLVIGPNEAVSIPVGNLQFTVGSA